MFPLSRFVLFAGSVSLLAAAGRPVETPATAQAKTALARLPLRFEANQGQARSSVRYSANAGGYRLDLTDHGPSLAFPNARRVNISLLHSNTAPAIEGANPLAARTDFFLGSRDRWRTNIRSYERVKYSAVYPGIDIVYYGNQSRLEYDFILEPGADPNAIRMKFDGADRVRISDNGDLILEAGATSFVQKRPVIYQEDPRTAVRQEIRGRYVLVNRTTAALRLDRYDRSRKLVIDPAISYLTYVGGTGTDQVNAVKLGPKNLLYIAGQTDTEQLSATGGPYNGGNSGLTDIFLAVLDATNYNLIYFTYLGGGNNDVPLAIDVDANGVLYVTGTTTSTDFPMIGAFQSTGATTSTDAFVIKFDYTRSGTDALVFSSYLGGNGIDSGNGVAVGPDGFIYVIGTTQSSDFPVTGSAYQPVQWGTQDTFLCQIDPGSGVLAYSSYLGGEGQDDGRAILVGKNGLVYFAASTLSQMFPMAGFQYSAQPFGAQDVIVGVMNMYKQGVDSLVYATYLGGSGNEEVRAMAFDAQGRVVVTGYTLSTDFPVVGDAVQPTNAGNSDVFVSVIDPNTPFQPGLIYSTYLGGSGGDVAYGVGTDSAGNIYVTGYTLSSDFPTTSNAPQAGWGIGTDSFVTKFKPGAGKGNLSFSTYIGLSGTYITSGLAVGPDGTMYLVGRGNVGLETTGNAFQTGGFAGATDGFLMVIAQ